MFCDKCGGQLSDNHQFCASCGKPVPPASPGPAQFQTAPRSYFRGRVARHASVLGVLWIVYSVLHLIPAFGFLTIGSIGWPFLHDLHTPFFLGPLLATIGGFMGITSILGIIAGVAVMNYRNWARICLLVLGFLALLSIPFGTAIGIYTLWGLLPAESETELTQLAHTR